MVKRPYADITVGSTVFDKMAKFEGTSSWDDMTDRATVTLPKNLRFFIGNNIFTDVNAFFKKGTYLTVNMGYFPFKKEVFRGYISEVNPSIPFVIHLQDAMWLLKQVFIKNYSNGYTNSTTKKLPPVTLKKLLTDILPDQFKHAKPDLDNQEYSFYCIDTAPFDMVIRDSATVVDVLNELRSKFTLFSWFRNGVLYVGLRNYPQDPFYKTNSRTAVFNFETITKDLECVIDGSNLEYKQKEDTLIKLVVKNIVSKENKGDPAFGELKQYIFGDKLEGDTVEQQFYNTPLDLIKQAAQKRLDELKYTGYRGELITFGEPFCQHGDIADLRSIIFPERDGKYQIKSVKRDYTYEDGIRQTLGLSTKIS